MITYDIMTTYSVMTTYDVMIMYSRLGVVYIGAGCAKLSGQGNVWPTTGSDELYCACQSKKSISQKAAIGLILLVLPLLIVVG